MEGKTAAAAAGKKLFDARGALLLLCIAGSLLCPAGADSAASPLAIDTADFSAGDATVPISSDPARWEPHKLPDDWNRTRPGVGGVGWYRFGVDLQEQPSVAWAVYVPYFWMNAAVYVNGIPMGGNRDLTTTAASNWNRPLIVSVPPSVLHAGVNEIQIGIWAYVDSHGGLGGVEIGPESVLRPIYERRLFVKVTLNQALLASTLLMAAFIGLLWLRRRRDTVYGWFALSCLLWAVKTFSFLIRDPEIPTWMWAWLANAVNYWVAVATAIMVHRYFGVRRRLLERAMLTYALLGTVLLPCFSLSHVHGAAVVLEACAFAVVVYAPGLAVTRAWKHRRADEIILAGGTVMLLGLAVHDALLDMELLSHQDWYLMHYGSPVLCFILTWLLTSRFVDALNSSEALSTHLSRRVEEKRLELEASYQRMQELERRQAIAEERERIVRDLHDGLGGQLVSALAITQREGTPRMAIEQTLREALDDLRLVIDSLDPAEGDLLALLGTLRGRLQSRLTQQGLQFRWHVTDLPQIPDFGPDKALQVLRIVQEAITNVLKHAQATAITLRTGTAPMQESARAALFVEVMDDGIGFSKERAWGRGLRHMRERATRVGGQLDLRSDNGGTTVRLWLPLDSTQP